MSKNIIIKVLILSFLLHISLNSIAVDLTLEPIARKPRIADKQYPVACNYRSGSIEKRVICRDYNLYFLYAKCKDLGEDNEPVPPTVDKACYFNQANSVGWQLGSIACVNNGSGGKKLVWRAIETCDSVEVSTVDANVRFWGPANFNRYPNSAPQQDVNFRYEPNAGSPYYVFTSVGSFALPAHGVAANCYRDGNNGIPTNSDFCDQTSVNGRGYCELVNYATGKYRGNWWTRYNGSNKTNPEICKAGIDYHEISDGDLDAGTMNVEITTGTFKWDDHENWQVTGCYNASGKRFSCSNNVKESDLFSNCRFTSTSGQGACGVYARTYANSHPALIKETIKSQVPGIVAGQCARVFKKIDSVTTEDVAKWRRYYTNANGALAMFECSQIELGKWDIANPSTSADAEDPVSPPLDSSFAASNSDKYFATFNNGKVLVDYSDSDNNDKYYTRMPHTDVFEVGELKLTVGAAVNFANRGGSTTEIMTFAAPVNFNHAVSLGSGASVTGDIIVSGNVTANSDRRFKKGFKDYSNPLDKILKLKGLNYKFRTDEFKDRKFPNGRQSGIIAQDAANVIPEIVTKDKEGYYSVNYMAIVPYLIEAVKELHKNIQEGFEQQKQSQTKLEAQISALELENRNLKERLEKLESRK